MHMSNFTELSANQSKQLFILGRQPAIGRAELETLLGGSQLHPVGPQAVLTTEIVDEAFFARLGGSIKLVDIIHSFPNTAWLATEQYIRNKLASQVTLPPEGKLQLGLSVYGIKASPAQIAALGLQLKKSLKRSARVVAPQGATALSTAQVLGNKLTGPQGREIVFYAHAGHTLVGVTRAEQDINAYTRRDQNRPMRDSKVGMLPPKLAQTIINLAGAKSPVLDPFCGTGVVLQEALLAGMEAYGTDLESRMIDYSRENLTWLDRGDARLETADATDHTWRMPVGCVASETYLGRPFSIQPNETDLRDAINTTNLILKKFLRNIWGQLPAGTRLCLAVPAWQAGSGRFRHLPMLDLLEEMGYNRVSFDHAGVEDLIYHREGQVVARELLVLIRK